MMIIRSMMAVVLTLLVSSAVQAETRYTRNVAIVIWNGAEVLDWAGPSEVFASASHFARNGDENAFEVYTVSRTKEPIVSQGFVDVLPDYSIEDAPQPDIIVLPGGGTDSVLDDPGFLEWASSAARDAEVAMSVCTGAFILGQAGLLDGAESTTWYGATDGLEEQFSETTVIRGRRFVDNGQVLTTAGVSAGIDGSLHLVARLLGRNVADRTAEYMEYRWSPESYLAQAYPALNPSLDSVGREIQQAGIYLRAKEYSAAVDKLLVLRDQRADDGNIWNSLGQAYYGLEEYTEAANAYLKAAETESLKLRALYNATCSFALAGASESALDALEKCIAAGFRWPKHLESDTDLDSIRETPRFGELVRSIEDATSPG